MNARKQRRVKIVSCKYSLIRVLLGESCDCITARKLILRELILKCQLELACENIIHLKKFSKCKISNREL